MKGVWGNRVSGIKDAGFDTIIHGMFCHRSHSDRNGILEAAARDRIKIIPILHTYYRDNKISEAVVLVKTWKSHPAIGGWLLLDEPSHCRIPIAEQRNFYNAIKNADPDHLLHINWMAAPSSEYYAADVCDIHTVDYYPVVQGYDWRTLIRQHLDAWINLTGNRDIIPVLQGFSQGPYLDPRGTIAEQYSFWKERGMTGRGYTIYQWETTGGDGIVENPAVLAEITAFNGAIEPLPYPCPYCPKLFATQAELDAHIAAEHPVIKAIDVGQYCTELSKQTGLGAETIISRGNPANASGILTQVTFWLKETASVKIGVFYIISGNTLKCRSVHNAGARPVGKSVVSVSLAIQSGDYIGVGKDAGGRFAYHYAYDGGMWKYKANTCIVNNQTTYELDPDGRISVCGIGAIPEVITRKTVLHTCNAKISYEVSSFAQNNNPLSCPHCGLSLRVEGIKGSEEIVEVPEVITPHIVKCPKCGSKLELLISSSANKNIQQYCPVCGEAAD